MKVRNGFVSNSSSSCFVCNTEMSTEEMSEKLHALYDFWVAWDGDTESWYGNSFESMFDEPYEMSKEQAEEMNEGWGSNIKEGDKIIDSASDNSIPWGLMDLIENKFEARRIHLG